MAVGPTQALQQTLSLFEEVSDSRTAKKIKDSHTVATRLQDVFYQARSQLPPGSEDLRESERLCEELKSKRFVFFYDSTKVRFGHGLWRFISMPFCNYVDVSKFQTYSKLLDLIKQAVETPPPQATATVPGGFPTGAEAAKVAELQQTIKTLTVQGEQLQGQNERLIRELQQARERSAELEQQGKQEQAVVGVKEEGEARLQRELVSLRSQLHLATESAQKGEGLEEKYRTASETLEQITREQKRLQEQLARLEKENEEFRKKHQTSEELVSRLTAQVAGEQAPDVAGQIARLEKEVRELRSELETKEQAHKQAIAKAEKSQKAAEGKVAELERENLQAKPSPAGVQKKDEPIQQEIADLRQQLDKISRELEDARALNEGSRRAQNELTRQLAEEKVAREEATDELRLLSHQYIKTLHDSLKAAFPPERGWGGSETIRFQEPQQGTPMPSTPRNVWVFHETVDDKGKASVSFNNGRGKQSWDPAVIELQDLVALVKRTKGIQGVIWIRGTPADTN